jgi:PII-like signaling protein
MSDEALQHGVRLTFYCHVRARHHELLVTEWLLQQARRQGVGGGSVFRATAGYGRHGVLREEAFFELADDLPAKVEFVLGEAEADALLAQVRAAGVDVVYARSAVDFAVLGATATK